MSAPLSVAEIQPSRGHGGRARIQHRIRLLALALAVLLVAAGVWLLWDNRRLVTTHCTIVAGQQATCGPGAEPLLHAQTASSTGPQRGSLRIAQVSDLHAASFGTFPERLIRAVDGAQPDLIALTGDLIDIRTTDLTDALATVDALADIAPTVMVLGNHEADSALREELIDALEQRGVLVLRDELRTLDLAGMPVALVGLDDPRVARADGADAAPAGETLEELSIPQDEPVVLLAHRPELLAEYQGHGIDLVLSGHAHGGQVRVPGAGGLFAPHQGWFPHLTEGAHRRGELTMVISRGLGNSVAGVRVNDPRELVVADLVV